MWRTVCVRVCVCVCVRACESRAWVMVGRSAILWWLAAATRTTGGAKRTPTRTSMRALTQQRPRTLRTDRHRHYYSPDANSAGALAGLPPEDVGVQRGVAAEAPQVGAEAEDGQHRHASREQHHVAELQHHLQIVLHSLPAVFGGGGGGSGCGGGGGGGGGDGGGGGGGGDKVLTRWWRWRWWRRSRRSRRRRRRKRMRRRRWWWRSRQRFIVARERCSCIANPNAHVVRRDAQLVQ